MTASRHKDGAGSRGSIRCWSCPGLATILVAGTILVLGVRAQAGLLVSTDSPLGFFTNVASRLLQEELNLDLNHIQIHPTNQYTPAVHRLLQVTANLYDSTTNRGPAGPPYPPSVFRPMFAASTNSDGSFEVAIAGFEELTNADFIQNPPRFRDLSDTNDLNGTGGSDMIYGIPVILGAKQGFPNFNEFAMDTAIVVERRLQFSRPSPSSPLNMTNQMFIVGISNALGVEAWNSYSNAFPHHLKVVVAADVRAWMTNEIPGQNLLAPPSGFVTNFQAVVDLPASTWLGFLDFSHSAASFQVPMISSFSMLADSTYSEARRAFVALTDSFESPSHFYVPHWWLNLNVRLRFGLVDLDAGRIVDYVNLDSWEQTLDLTTTLMSGGICGDVYTPDSGDGSEWCPNRFDNASVDSPTYGMLNQIVVGLGLVQPPSWSGFVLESPAGLDRNQSIDFFRAQFGLGPIYNPATTFYRSNVFESPFEPIRTIHSYVSWQANDPLIHHTLGQLRDLNQTNLVAVINNPTSGLANLGLINPRYNPWGGNPSGVSSPQTRYNLALKDPLITRADDWNFPTGQPLSPTWLGEVHRGTPWQTLYLKSVPVEPGLWGVWSGAADPQQAALVQPTIDWRVLSLLVPLFNTNGPAALISANETNLALWTSTLDGLLVLTNTSSDSQLLNPGTQPQFDEVLMSSNSPEAATIAAGIIGLRSNQPGFQFPLLAEILTAPQLSVASPWLNTSGVHVLMRGITDQAYEAVPAQLLARLRPDSFGTVVEAGPTNQIQFSGFDGYRYVVQSSSNLVDWVSRSTNSPANGRLVFVDSEPPGRPGRFYRTRLLPD